jgi:hypothetical protein
MEGRSLAMTLLPAPKRAERLEKPEQPPEQPPEQTPEKQIEEDLADAKT